MQLPAKATLQQAAALAASLPQALAGSTGVFRVDASLMQEVDSSTIALLLQAQRLAQAAGRSFEVTGLPPKLLALASLYGVDSLLAPAERPVG
jgi:phospholipid transport system transporter-binding protein